MNCKEFSELISLYIDGYLEDKEKESFEKHLKDCEDCCQNYMDLVEIVNDIETIEEASLPENFHSELMEKINKEREIDMSKKKFNWKKISSYAAVFVVGVLITSVLSAGLPSLKSLSMDGADYEMSPQESYNYGNSEDNFANDKTIGTRTDDRGESENKLDNNTDPKTNAGDIKIDKDKIIYTSQITIEVNNYDQVNNQIVSYIEGNGGFVQNSSSYNYDYYEKSENKLKQGNLQVRIPSNNFKDAVDKIAEFGEVVNNNVSSDNVTFQYKDIQNKLNNLEVQRERLLDILKKAKNVSEILEIERELNRIRTEIEWQASQIKNWDQNIAYSTININIKEVATSQTVVKSPFGKLIENIKKGFIHSINVLLQILSWIIVFLFKLIPFIPIIVLGWWVIKKIINKRK